MTQQDYHNLKGKTMATTKTTTVIFDDLAVVSGGTPDEQVDLSAGYGAILYLKVTNGATAPTTPFEVDVYISPDQANWFTFSSLTGSLNNNGETESYLEVPSTVKFIRASGYNSSSGTPQTITIYGAVDNITGV